MGSAPVHATLAQPAAGADSLKDLRARRAQDHACLAVYILKVYRLKMTLLVPVEPVTKELSFFRAATKFQKKLNHAHARIFYM